MKQRLYLGVLAGANIGVAFLTQWYIFTQLGAGLQTDALFAGMALPQVILLVVSGSLVHVLVPLLAGEDSERLKHDAWAMWVLVGGFFAILTLVLYAAAPWWTPLTVPGFDAAGQALTIELTRIQLIGMLFAAINGVQMAAYHARHRFIGPEAALLGASLAGLLGTVWLLPHYGIAAAAWMISLRMGLQTVLLLPGMGRPVRPDLRSPAVALAWARLKPLLLGTTYYKTDPLVDRFLLSAAGSGSLSLYYLAQQIYAAATYVVNMAIAAPLVPRLSTLHKTGQASAFNHAYQRELLLVGVLCLAGLAVLGVAGEPLLNLLVGYSKITDADISTLWQIMMWLGGLFVGGAGGQICATCFYAVGNTTTPTRLSVVTYSIYIPCKIAAFYAYGVMGLALATSLYYLANLFLQMAILQKTLAREPLAQ